MAQRKYKRYETMRKAIERAGIPNPGAVTRVLLTTFVDGKGYIFKETIQDLCASHRDWVNDLVRNNILVKHASTPECVGKEHVRYIAGTAIVKYVNEELTLRNQLATAAQVMAVHDDVKDLKERVSNLESAMSAVYEDLQLGEPDPPGYVKARKKARHLRAVSDTLWKE